MDKVTIDNFQDFMQNIQMVGKCGDPQPQYYIVTKDMVYQGKAIKAGIYYTDGRYESAQDDAP